MTKMDSSVAPKERINVTFKPGTGNNQEEIELPMKIMILGDFLQRNDERSLIDRKPVSLTKNNFKDVMANQNLTIEINTPNALQDFENDREMHIRLSFSNMRDFEPTNIINQIPEARKLYQIREALVSLKGPLGNIPSFRQAIDTIIKDPEQSKRIEKELITFGINTSNSSQEK